MSFVHWAEGFKISFCYLLWKEEWFSLSSLMWKFCLGSLCLEEATAVIIWDIRLAFY